MKKYIDISNEIKDQFKTGIQILDDVSNDIQEFLTLLQSSSGETIELIRNDLTFLKDKYTTIKEKVEKRSSEIEERANTYDACLEPYIKDKGNLHTYDECLTGYKTKKIMEVLGPDYSDGIGHFRRIDKIYTYDSDNNELCKDTNDEWHKIKEMSDFTGGLWNASDYIVVDTVTAASVTKEEAISNMNEAEADEYIRSNLNPEQWHVYQNSPPGTYSGMTPEEIVANFKDSSVSSLDEYY